MSTYRISRNIEKSIIDYITTELTTDGWVGIYVEKVFAQVYEGKFPCILVNVSNRPDTRREIGSNTLSKFFNIEIRIFANDDGQRLDLSDWLLDKVMPGIVYYQYVITNGVVSSKIAKGRINILEITSNRKELVNLEGLSKEDKFRHLLVTRCRVATTL